MHVTMCLQAIARMHEVFRTELRDMLRKHKIQEQELPQQLHKLWHAMEVDWLTKRLSIICALLKEEHEVGALCVHLF